MVYSISMPGHKDKSPNKSGPTSKILIQLWQDLISTFEDEIMQCFVNLNKAVPT